MAASLPQALEALIAELGKLPGVGRRSAERMAFAVLAAPIDRAESLAAALHRVHDEVGLCERCGAYTDAGRCPICDDPARDRSIVCVVETPLDVVSFERAGGYRGRYHVLGGVLSPLKGVTPGDLRFSELERRLDGGPNGEAVTEVILATSPGVEGDATAIYLTQRLAPRGLRLTRIGRGIPMGASLEHADGGTLRLALEGRRPVDG